MDSDYDLHNPKCQRADHRRQQLLSCARYKATPISHMTGAEVTELATDLALEAAGSLRLTPQEVISYRSALLESVHYFNCRDAHHAAYMRYLSECRRQEALSRQIQDERRRKRKNDIVVHII